MYKLLFECIKKNGHIYNEKQNHQSLSCGRQFVEKREQKSLAETTMFRVEKRFRKRLKARSIEAQESESICKCFAIHQVNQLGMPKGK